MTLDAATKSVTATWTAITAPTVTITSATIDAKNATASFAFTVTGGSPLCKLDSGTAVACTSPKSYTNLAAGSHTFLVSATNGGGTGSDSRTWLTDAWADAVNGLDTHLGNSSSPFKTITTAIASAANTVWVKPGSYDAANGETFPLVVQNGQSLIGDIPNKGCSSGNGCQQTKISGEGSFFATGTVFATGGSTVAGFWVYDAGRTSGAAAIWVLGANASIHDNRVGGWDVGIHASGATNVSIANCQIYAEGLATAGVLLDNSTGMLQGNLIGGNYNGVVINGSMLDLGSCTTSCATGQSRGGNYFGCDSNKDILTAVGSAVLHAENNFWDHTPPGRATDCSFQDGYGLCTTSNDSLDYAGYALSGSPCQ